MTDNLFSGAKGMVFQQIQDALGLVSEQLGDNSPKQKVRLTSKQQIDRFLRMDSNDFQELRMRVGEEQFMRYHQRMMQLSSEVK